MGRLAVAVSGSVAVAGQGRCTAHPCIPLLQDGDLDRLITLGHAIVRIASISPPPAKFIDHRPGGSGGVRRTRPRLRGPAKVEGAAGGIVARFIDELKRTHRCGELRASDIGKEVVLFGWVAQPPRSRRAASSSICATATGITQVVFDPRTRLASDCAEVARTTSPSTARAPSG